MASSRGLSDVRRGRSKRSTRFFTQFFPTMAMVCAYLWYAACPLQSLAFLSASLSSQVATSSRRLVRLGMGAGFGDSPGAFAVETIKEPAGGWPTLSVVVLSPDGRVASSVALQQLAAQDYPMDRLKEVVVFGAEEVRSETPASLQALLKEFEKPEADSLNLHTELAGCSGDVVAFWGDDHVSSPTRLRKQVADSMSAGRATLLRRTWFFDHESSKFAMVKKWPTAELAEAMKVSEGFAELMVSVDSLTLCGSRDALVEASKTVEPTSSSSEGLKELASNLQKSDITHVVKDFEWATVGSPPDQTVFQRGKPEGSLVKIAQTAWPKERATKSKFSYASLCQEIEETKMKPAQAIEKILAQDTGKQAKPFDCEKIRRVVIKSLMDSSPQQAAAALDLMTKWRGIQVGGGDAQAVRQFPAFFAVFQAMKHHINENADFFGMREIGEMAEALLLLSRRMSAADDKVRDIMVKLITTDFLGAAGGDAKAIPTDAGLKTADFVGAVGLRDPLFALCSAAADVPLTNQPVQSLTSLCYALAESNVMHPGLSQKVAKGIMNDIDKLRREDIGKVFIAMHDKEWFKDEKTVAYLTQSLQERARVLKREDPNLAAMLVANQAAE